MNISLKTIVTLIGVVCLLLAIGHQSRRMRQLERQMAKLRVHHNSIDAEWDAWKPAISAWVLHTRNTSRNAGYLFNNQLRLDGRLQRLERNFPIRLLEQLRCLLDDIRWELEKRLLLPIPAEEPPEVPRSLSE